MDKEEISSAIKGLIKRQAKDVEQPEEALTEYELTPKGIVFAALADAYGDCFGDEVRDIGRFDAFLKAALRGLSLKATAGERRDLLGEDFNQFFLMFVNSVNMCGKLHKLLEDNGIDVDVDADEDGGEAD